MSQHPRHAVQKSPEDGRRRPRTSRLVLVGLVVGAVLGTTGAVVATRASASSAGGCGEDVVPLRVAVAPELSYALSAALQQAAARGTFCLESAQIVAADPAKTARSLTTGAISADVWIPDSSTWLDQLGDRLPKLRTAPSSIATSPLVLAVPAGLTSAEHGRPATVEALLPTPGRVTGPVRWVLPRPEGSAATTGAVLALRAAASGRPDASTVISTVIRGSSQESPTDDEVARTGHPLATPMSEQQLYAYNLDHPGARLNGIYPNRDQFVFDYPVTVLNDDPSVRASAASLLAALADGPARTVLGDAGFRTPAGEAVSGQASPNRKALAHATSAAEVAAAGDAYRAVLQPSRLLALIDVSGSMAKPVPSAGGATRLDLATRAAVNGLAVYPDDTAVGLWVFATDLTKSTDYRVLAQVAPLGRGADGVSGRERVAMGLAGTSVAKGHWTGLYDSVLAAVREMRRTWDPDRVNSVVVITDGGNSDRHGISLDQLLRTLRSENDPSRPVAVYSIAYGPSGDLASLQRISTAVGGKAYAAPDPRMINDVLRDAVGRRACTPRC